MAPTVLGNDFPVNKRLRDLLVRLKWEHMAAGVSGGVMSTLVLHPLDLVKIRFQGKNFFLSFLHLQTILCFKLWIWCRFE